MCHSNKRRRRFRQTVDDVLSVEREKVPLVCSMHDFDATIRRNPCQIEKLYIPANAEYFYVTIKTRIDSLEAFRDMCVHLIQWVDGEHVLVEIPYNPRSLTPFQQQQENWVYHYFTLGRRLVLHSSQIALGSYVTI